jgi:ABC-type multidrug transport system fused ATPase/permease subunit
LSWYSVRNTHHLRDIKYTKLTKAASFYGGAQISKNIGERQKIWVDSVQKRISITASVLSDMKSVKMMGLSNRVTALLQNHRVQETRKMAAFRWSIVWQNVVQNLPWALAPALTFTVYVAQAAAQGKQSIGTTQAFTSLAIINLLTDPTAKLVSAIPSTASSIGCFDRIQNFLVTPPRVDQRTGLPSNPPTRISIVPHDDMELQSTMECRSREGNPSTIRASHLSLRPSPSSDVLLENISFSVQRNSLTMVVGPVASGKTTLLKAILGDIPFDATGELSVADGRIAFCSQVPWLPNTSIRDAITGPAHNGALFNAPWYEKCLDSCDLQHDIKLLPNGDSTRLGTAGAALSGGQKHRIALARAVYSRAKILLLDDVLGALDATTRRKVFDRLFGDKGLLRGSTTVVLATHASWCHFIIFFRT